MTDWWIAGLPNFVLSAGEQCHPVANIYDDVEDSVYTVKRDTYSTEQAVVRRDKLVARTERRQVSAPSVGR